MMTRTRWVCDPHPKHLEGRARKNIHLHTVASNFRPKHVGSPVLSSSVKISEQKTEAATECLQIRIQKKLRQFPELDQGSGSNGQILLQVSPVVLLKRSK